MSNEFNSAVNQDPFTCIEPWRVEGEPKYLHKISIFNFLTLILLDST